MPRLQKWDEPVPEGHKWCFKCKEAKPHAEFNKRAQNKDGYHYSCRSCINSDRAQTRKTQIEAGITPRNDQWNKENRNKINTVRTERRRIIRDYIRSLKAGKPCVDCGGVFPPTCMDWDHREPSDKEFNICGTATRELYDNDKILSEIAKCDLVCANCHRIRSAIQRGEDVRMWGL